MPNDPNVFTTGWERELGTARGTRIGAQAGARVRNTGAVPCRYLVISTTRFPDVAEQLDTGTILAIAGPGQGWAWPAGAEGDYTDLTRQAIQADPGG